MNIPVLRFFYDRLLWFFIMHTEVRQRAKHSPETENNPSLEKEILPRKQPTVYKPRLICFILFILILFSFIFVEFLVECPIEPQYHNLPTPPEFTGGLIPSDQLSNSLHLYEGQLKGPESIVVKNGHIYTGTAQGQVLDIYEGVIRVLASFGSLEPSSCGSYKNEPSCGRPLGMRVYKEDYLLVLDAYLGLFMVSTKNGDFVELFSSKTDISGGKTKFLNDLDIAKDGRIFFTDSSSKYERRHNVLEVMESAPHGRLLVYDPNTQLVSVWADKLYFPNGVQISHDQKYVLVSQTTKCNIVRFNVNEPSDMSIFADNLPGLPDNIRLSSTGGYWVTFATIRRRRFSAYDFLARRPWIRQFLAKVIDLESVAQLVARPYGLLLELDQDGAVSRSLHDPSGTVIGAVSEVEDVDGVLYLGSYKAPFIGKLDNNLY